MREHEKLLPDSGTIRRAMAISNSHRESLEIQYDPIRQRLETIHGPLHVALVRVGRLPAGYGLTRAYRLAKGGVINHELPLIPVGVVFVPPRQFERYGLQVRYRSETLAVLPYAALVELIAAIPTDKARELGRYCAPTKNKGRVAAEAAWDASASVWAFSKTPYRKYSRSLMHRAMKRLREKYRLKAEVASSSSEITPPQKDQSPPPDPVSSPSTLIPNEECQP